MLSLVISTIVFFVASFYLKRYFDEMEMPKGMVRGFTIFVFASAISYAAAWLIDHIA